MKQRSNVLIGGLGFVGRNLVDYLLRHDEYVHIIDSNHHQLEWHRAAAYKENVNLTFEFYDGTDLLRLSSTFRNVRADRVFHLAANSDIRESSKILPDYRNTLLTTLALCELIRAGFRIPEVFFASTSAIYGNFKAPLSVDPKHLCIPTTSYGWTKRASELALIGACQSGTTKLLIARFPNVVGPYLTHGLIFDLMRKVNNGEKKIDILGDGFQRKPYVHTSELTQIIISSLESLSESVSILNISPEDQITVRDIVSLFASEVGTELDFSYGEEREGWPGDIPEYAFDIEEAKKSSSVTKLSSKNAVLRAIKENLDRS